MRPTSWNGFSGTAPRIVKEMGMDRNAEARRTTFVRCRIVIAIAPMRCRFGSRSPCTMVGKYGSVQ